jgi:hypothetical protein
MITATGPQSVAIQRLAEMVSASSAFQNRRGKYTQAEASQHVHFPYVDDPFQVKRPYVVITVGELNWQKRASGAQNFLMPMGSLGLWIADDDEYGEEDRKSGLIDFVNFVDGVLSDVVLIAGRDDLLAITEIQQVEPPAVSDPRSVSGSGMAQKPFWMTRYNVEWDSVG